MSNTALLSPYQAAKLVNEQLTELGIDKVLPPQMFYTYTKKGYIKSVEVDDKRKIDPQDLADWFTNYVEKVNRIANEKAAKAAKSE